MTKIIIKIKTNSPKLYDQIMKYKKRNPVSDIVLRGQYIAEVRGFLNALETMGMITQAERRFYFHSSHLGKPKPITEMWSVFCCFK